jgi:ABC-2 type transport system ATP-binding protein
MTPVRIFVLGGENGAVLAPASESAIRTVGLRRVYTPRGGDPVVALDGVDLDVRRGELFGVLGPNGAGKTTLIKILVTLLAPTEGTAEVDGLDVVRDFRELRPRIAMVSGGENSGYGMLTVREQLWMFSQFYGLPSRPVKARIDEYLHRLGLFEARDRPISALSSGMRQKMNLIRGLITDPRVLFLDEPTVALDVGAARDVRVEVRRWMDENPDRTVILTTHYMAEADELCDRIAIVDRGRIIALDTPAGLKGAVESETTVDLEIGAGDDILATLRALDGVVGASIRAGETAEQLTVILSGDAVLGRVITTIEGRGRGVLELRKREATLEEAFVRLVGIGIDEADR